MPKEELELAEDEVIETVEIEDCDGDPEPGGAILVELERTHGEIVINECEGSFDKNNDLHLERDAVSVFAENNVYGDDFDDDEEER